MKRNILHFELPDGTATAPASAVLTLMEVSPNEIDIYACQRRRGRFNDHTLVRLGHADAVRLYLWLGEVVGKEVQP